MTTTTATATRTVRIFADHFEPGLAWDGGPGSDQSGPCDNDETVREINRRLTHTADHWDVETSLVEDGNPCLTITGPAGEVAAFLAHNDLVLR